VQAERFLKALASDFATAQDNLLIAKINQAEFANRSRRPDPHFKTGDKVLLSTLHRRRDYLGHDSSRCAKFLPRFDGPYTIQLAHPERSSYTLHLPNNPYLHSTFHASLLRPYHSPDPNLTPDRVLDRPGPVVTPDGAQEFLIDRIVDERRRGRRIEYLVLWQGWGLEDARWLPRAELEDCEALDTWLSNHPVPAKSLRRSRRSSRNH
jgi:hypothetical protein